MQLKFVTAIIVLFLVLASLLVSGCTTSTTSNLPPAGTTPTYTPTSSSNGGVVSPAEFGNTITQSLKANYPDLNIVTPFAYKGKVNGHYTYTGVIKDGSKELKVWNRTVTYTLFDTREEARAAFSQAKTTATSQGYGGASDAYDALWIAYYGGTWHDTIGSKEVTITVCQPGGGCGTDYYTRFDQYFGVTTEYKTRLE